ncbi:alpha/beta fold hydrolase [Streptomyces sp. NPDC058221]|uniref:alpha/beta fold hydrolase n=1 Tax=Streptomyces sp. NPDC058221 TaxID=3346388 RepID=UPI0036E31510
MSEYESVWTHLNTTPHRLSWVDVDGVSTRFLDAGPADAPVVVMLHGTAGSLENFCVNVAAYAEHFRVLALDMLGCGYTDKPEQDYLITDYAEHLRGFLDALDVDSAALVGVSLGSWVAARLAHDHPGRVTSLVMIAPAGIITDAEQEAAVAQGVRKRRTAAATEPSWQSVSAAMTSLVLDPEQLMDDLIAVRLAIYRQPSMTAAMPRLLAFTRGGQHLSPEEWARIQQPVMVIAAVDAPGMFLDNAYAVHAAAPATELVELGGCDHWAQYEQPAEFTAATVPFVQRAVTTAGVR